MADSEVTIRIAVDGMTCGNCEQRIEKAVRELDGVRTVSASASLSEVTVSFDGGRTGVVAIRQAIRLAGCEARDEQVPAAAPAGSKAAPVLRFLGLLAVVAGVFLIIRFTVGFTFLPTVSQNMGYGLIFVVGLMTSLHCIAMCGGIALSQGIKRGSGACAEPNEPPRGGARRLAPNLLYNAGRVVSYTIIGGAVGALGSLFTLSPAIKGLMPVIAGAFMLLLGVRMLGIFPWLSRLRIRLPGIAGERISAAASGRGPFVVGLLNGLMPCGPLQTMQVYALGTGSFLAGALSMFLFSLGTVPLLLGFGAVSSLLSARFNRRMLQASGVLVMALGLVMFARGANLFGVSLPAFGRPSVAVARVEGGLQTVATSIDSGQYHPFIVQKGIPVRWIITAKAEDLNGCNNPLTVPRYGITRRLVPGQNIIEFTPEEEGTIAYTCWMGMISSSIRVVADVAKLTPQDLRPSGPLLAGSAPAADIASAFGGGQGPAAAAPAAGCSCCARTP